MNKGLTLTIEDKRVEFDNAAYGTIGLETAFGILNQIFDIETSISLLTKGRERYQIRTPQIKEGEVACLTLFEPSSSSIYSPNEIFSTSKNSIFTKKPLKGSVYGVISENKILISST